MAAFAAANGEQITEQLAPMELSGVETGRAQLELAADLFLLTGAARREPLDLYDLAERHLAERPVRGNTARQKRHYALTAAVLIAAGAEPEDTGWWRHDNPLVPRP